MAEPQSRVLTLVFTDLADSTALKTERGDAVVGELIARHRDHVLQIAEHCNGRVIDWAGDGCFLTFETSSAAVTFALRLQQVHHYESDLPGVRVGVHMGEVTEKPFDGTVRIEGLAVDLGARISGLAMPGQVLISAPVHQSAKQRLSIHEFGQPIRWATYGPYTIKGFDEPLDIREGGLENISPFMPPQPSEKAWPEVPGQSNGGEKPIRRIAVLPFTSLSGETGEEWFVDGMTETLIAELAKIKALTVISRTSVMFYKGANKPLPEIAAELNADAIVEGSAMRAGDRVRITAQLIRAADDAHLWADRYDGTMAEVFDLQSDVALAIAKEVNVALSPIEVAASAVLAPTDNTAALEALMRARHAYHIPTQDGLHEAMKFIDEALAADPECADAYTLRAGLYAQHIVYGSVQPAGVAFPAMVAIQEATALGGESADLYVAIAMFARTVEWDWDKAIANASRALKLNPSDAEAKSVAGFAYIYKRQAAEAHRFIDDAIDLNPLDPRPYTGKLATFLGDRKFDEAIEYGLDVVQRFPAMPTLRANLVGAYLNLHRFDDACAEAERILAGTGRQLQFLSLAGYCYACAGRSADAEAAVAEMAERSSGESLPEIYAAFVDLVLGNQERAYPAFERAYHDRVFTLLWISAFLFEDLLPYECDDRFKRLFRRVIENGSKRRT